MLRLEGVRVYFINLLARHCQQSLSSLTLTGFFPSHDHERGTEEAVFSCAAIGTRAVRNDHNREAVSSTLARLLRTTTASLRLRTPSRRRTMTLEYIDSSANPNGVVINVVVWILLVFAGIFIGLRCYCKVSRRRRLWWDDYLLALSWIFLAASCAASSANTRLGFGLHIYDVPLSNLITIGIVSNVSGFTSVLSIDLSKTSFGITLFRLTDGWLRWLILAIIIVLNITQLTSVLFFWASCDPPAKIWNPQLPGTCWPPKLSVVIGNVAGALSALFDVMLALIPWKILFRFRMYGREKVGVAVSMSMGVFAGIACIVKLTTLPLLEKGDFTYYGKPLVLWGFTEASLTIVAASIPFLRSLWPTPARTQELPSLEVPTANRHSETANAAHGGRRKGIWSEASTTAPVHLEDSTGRGESAYETYLPQGSRNGAMGGYELESVERTRESREVGGGSR
ncbi:hypothetical protein B0T26DRAFT_685727 [Lasiosphaeria miniovina]|uniref:Rhodopsin domain-containing protein n=1 Tax=Lasiosphaeria miniovina TaxID=1954250 RepID=A0AA40EFY2_9PEZI|nr:uncharacterized protein B0T26DRAFT_685727 [Lasiosphaeria miniovina]KAK0733788.1 hypothetical protein B0T26DRAFT_685727 [Lasiosphaeria miniovina]